MNRTNPNAKLPRQQKIDFLMDYQTKNVTDAIRDGEDPNSFDLPGAELFYESMTDDELTMQLDELDDAMMF